jgi:hypothetical protein
MNSRVSTIVQIVLLLAVIFLAYRLYEIIQEPIRFEKIKTKRYDKIKERLEDIRDVQKAYRAEYNEFAGDFNTLIAFVDTGKQTIIERKDSTFTYFDKVYLKDREKDTIITRVIGYRDIKESLFEKNFDPEVLRYIPLTDNKKFSLEADKLTVNDIIVPVFEARATNKDIFADIWEKYEDFIDKDYALKVGSLTEPTLSGNWK